MCGRRSRRRVSRGSSTPCARWATSCARVVRNLGIERANRRWYKGKMASVSSRPTLSRRAFVRRLGGTALVSAFGAQLLAACTTPAAAPTTAPAAPPTAAPTVVSAVVSRSGRVSLPTYVPPADVPAPDVPGGTITPPGYTRYPAKLYRSVANPPAKGGEINIITQTLGATPVAMDSNPVWQEINKRIGATLKLGITPFADYGSKIPTIIAGNDL